jgi:pyridoxine 4-dehydrogenase
MINSLSQNAMGPAISPGSSIRPQLGMGTISGRQPRVVTRAKGSNTFSLRFPDVNVFNFKGKGRHGRVTLGRTSIVTNQMGFGTWAWGNKLLWNYDESQDEELQRVFNLMVDNGVTLFDTADSYGTGKLEGRSEELLGKFARERERNGKPNKVHIATKLAAYPWRTFSRVQWVNACRASLRRMGLEKISMAQLHWSTANYQPLQERVMWDGLVAMADEGLVDCVGVSNYGPKQLQRIHRYLEKRQVPLASCQIQYSLLSRGKLQRDAKAACDDLGVSMIAYSPLGLGMLTGTYAPDDTSNYPKLPNPRSILFNKVMPEAAPLLDSLRDVAKCRNKTMSQVAINYCISKGTVPIAGARTLQQAQNNLGALNWRLSDSEILELENASDRVMERTGGGMTQNVFQTL